MIKKILNKINYYILDRKKIEEIFHKFKIKKGENFEKYKISIAHSVKIKNKTRRKNFKVTENWKNYLTEK